MQRTVKSLLNAFCAVGQRSPSLPLVVSVAVSKLGCIELLCFVEPRVKVDGNYYREDLLTKQTLPVMRRIAGITLVLQQDGAPRS